MIFRDHLGNTALGKPGDPHHLGSAAHALNDLVCIHGSSIDFSKLNVKILLRQCLVFSCSNRRMDIHEIRRRNLRQLVDSVAEGNMAKFGQMIGKERSQVAQYLSPTYNGGRSIGERVARSIEIELEVDVGLLDRTPGSALDNSRQSQQASKDWPLPAIPRERIESLEPAKLERLQGAIALALAQIDRDMIVSPSKTVSGGRPVNTDTVEDPFASLGPTPKMPWEPGWRPEDDAAAVTAQPSTPRPIIGGVVANVSAGTAPAANDKFDKVPELGEVRLAAGDGFENDREHETGYLTFRRSFLRSVGADGNKARVVYAQGDSMSPVIQDGAGLLVVPDDSITLRDLAAGGIYAINYDGKMIVKTITKNNGRWVARSYNPAYMDIPLEGDDVSVRILGRVVWSGSKLPQNDVSQWMKR